MKKDHSIYFIDNCNKNLFAASIKSLFTKGLFFKIENLEFVNDFSILKSLFNQEEVQQQEAFLISKDNYIEILRIENFNSLKTENESSFSLIQFIIKYKFFMYDNKSIIVCFIFVF